MVDKPIWQVAERLVKKAQTAGLLTQKPIEENFCQLPLAKAERLVPAPLNPTEG
jgi:hypothetical protein